jgi:tetratricopeptide (TPR) repeat protein
VDPSSVELLGQLLEQLPRERVLLLLTFRPDFAAPWPARADVTPLLLSRLTRSQLGQLVRKAARGRELPDAWVEEIIARSDGVPLFAEEVTKAVLESNPDPQGSGKTPELRIPDTLQDSLMARLDALGPLKELAQAASVLGREFEYAMLRSISPMKEADLQQALRAAVREELFYQRGAPPESSYLFRHALIRDAAYESLLRATRQRQHRRVAETLIEQMPALAEEQPELVARHWTAAGETEPAIGWWRRAGERAQARSAHREAIGHLERALELLVSLEEAGSSGDREIDLRLALGASLQAAEGYSSPRVQDTYEQAAALCEGVQDPERLATALYGLGQFQVTAGALDRCTGFADRLLRLEGGRPERHAPGGHYLVGTAALGGGDFGTSIRELEASLEGLRHTEVGAQVELFGSPITSYAHSMLAWSHWSVGRVDRALDDTRKALEWGRNHPLGLACALTFGARFHKDCGDRSAAARLARECVALCEELDFPLWLSTGQFVLAWAEAEGDAAIDGVREAIAGAAAVGAQLFAPYLAYGLAEVSHAGDRHADARGALEMALALSRQHAMHFWDAELHRLRGETALVLPENTEAEAEADFERALEIARSQSARSLELRAAMSMARLRQRQGEPAEARGLLQPAYDWFTEGFDTQDLKKARRLLEELAS